MDFSVGFNDLNIFVELRLFPETLRDIPVEGQGDSFQAAVSLLGHHPEDSRVLDCRFTDFSLDMVVTSSSIGTLLR